MFKTQTVENAMGDRNEFLVKTMLRNKPKPAVRDLFEKIMK